jgi:hypothetical protein
MITETDEVKAALAAARRRWPNDTPSQLLQRLIAQGHASMTDPVAERRAAIAAASGAGTGLYGPNYLTELRKDWDRDWEQQDSA